MPNNLIIAEKEAVQLRNDLEISPDAAIDFAFVLQALNIRFRKAPLPNNVLGASKVEGLNRLIVVSSCDQHASRERFTTAHELGHIALHHGYSQCKYMDIYGKGASNTREAEANAFASAFLLPPMSATQFVRENNVDITSADKLAKQYRISLTVAVTSLVKNAPMSACVFFQSNGRIEYSISSQSCMAHARKGSVSAGHGINAVNTLRREFSANCDYTDWFFEKKGKDYHCTEETIYLPTYKRAISIVQVWEKD